MDMDHSPSFSQVNSDNTRIFIYPDGETPIPIFVEASSVIGRPKLVRTARISGASITHHPEDSHIILVDSNTEPGVQFIRDWGSDPTKTVLEYRWVNKCLEQGRALLQPDHWGDCLAVDDGSLKTREELDEPASEEHQSKPNPLPTPRPTPSDKASARERSVSSRPNTESEGHANAGFSNASISQPGTPTISTFNGAPQFSHVAGFSQGSSQQQHFSQGGQTYNTNMHQIQHPQQYQNYSNPYLQPPPSQMPYFSSSQYPQPMGQMNGPQQPIDPQQFQVYQAMQIMMANPQMLFDMMQHQNMPMMQAQQMQQQQMIMPPMNDQAASSGYTVYPNAPGPSNKAKLHLAESPQPPLSASGSTSPEICAPSLRRRSPVLSSPSPPPKQKSKKGKEKQATTSRRSSTKRKRSFAYESSENEIVNSPGPDIPQSSQVTSPRRAGSIFTTLEGQPLLLFVQVETPKRNVVVPLARKNGAKMTGDIKEADIIVLNAHSSEYEGFLSQVEAYGKVALRPAYLHDCVAQQALLIPEESHILCSEMVKVKTQPRTPKLAKVTIQNATKATLNKPATKRSKKALAALAHSGPPSPSPPPAPSLASMSGKGAYAYTEADTIFFRKSAKHYLNIDDGMSATEIFRRIHEKAPHHTASAWQTQMKKVLPLELDELRKRAKIAHRKTAVGESPHTRTNAEAGPSKKSDSSGPNTEEMQDVEAILNSRPEERDFVNIVNFFVSGGSEEGTDEEVWDNLAKKCRCQTAVSWPEFYESRQAEIQKAIDNAQAL